MYKRQSKRLHTEPTMGKIIIASLWCHTKHKIKIRTNCTLKAILWYISMYTRKDCTVQVSHVMHSHPPHCPPQWAATQAQCPSECACIDCEALSCSEPHGEVCVPRHWGVRNPVVWQEKDQTVIHQGYTQSFLASACLSVHLSLSKSNIQESRCNQGTSLMVHRTRSMLSSVG